jgi:glycosyltransferase involved in cell wall biosynthesis
MKILFIHPNIPGQYKHLARIYGANPEHTVVFLCKPREMDIPGVHKVEYEVPRDASPATHRYMIGAEKAVLQGQEVWRVCKKLREEEGFIPDIICVHPGWGDGLFLKDIYPESTLFSYFEFYYHFHGKDVNFDPELPVGIDDAARIRVKNTVNLLNLEAADWGISPTHWQKSVHPAPFHSKMTVLHEGIDTDAVKPDAGAQVHLQDIGVTLKKGDPVVTYVTRNFEHYRGSHYFLRAAKIMLEERPDLRIIAAGADQVSYGRAAPKGKTYRHMLLDEINLDRSRIHFVGHVPYEGFLKILQVSAAHVYLTVPFVLSWSMLEAMSAECLVIGSNTPPVREVLEDGKNGILCDFFSPEDIARKTLDALERPQDYEPLRKAARQTILQRYDLKKILPLQQQLIEQLAKKQFPPAVQANIDALYDANVERRLVA